MNKIEIVCKNRQFDGLNRDLRAATGNDGQPIEREAHLSIDFTLSNWRQLVELINDHIDPPIKEGPTRARSIMAKNVQIGMVVEIGMGRLTRTKLVESWVADHGKIQIKLEGEPWFTFDPEKRLKVVA